MGSLYSDIFARFYDIIYDRIRSKVDSGYFLCKIRKTSGPVLEVGVGTGRFFTEALSLGINIHGIDISPSMIRILKTKLDPKDHFRITLQDIQTYSFDQEFALVVAPFRVFMHLTETEEQLLALNNVHDSLKEGGEFIFDTFIPDPLMIANGIADHIDFEGEYAPGETLKRIATARYDLIRQVADVSFRFEWTENGTLLCDTWKTKLRFFFRYELEYLLQRSKFSGYQIFGNYQEEELSAGSRDFVVVCKK